jgi:hypothetical protein
MNKIKRGGREKEKGRIENRVFCSFFHEKGGSKKMQKGVGNPNESV